MTQKWFFEKEGQRIWLRATMTGPGGTIGDARDYCDPGEDWRGIPYGDLAKARAGAVVVAKNGRARIVVSAAEAAKQRSK